MTQREQMRRQAPIRAVEAYWTGLLSEGNVPLRSQIDPRGIENALENAFLVEKIAPSMAKFRVAGTHLSDLMGMSVAGMPLSTLIEPEQRARFGSAVERLFSEPAIIRLELAAETGFGRPDLTGHLILMPLRSDFGEVTRGLGALVTHGRIGRTPRRFGIQRMSVRHALDTNEALRPSELTPILEPLPRQPVPEPSAPGFAEPQTSFAGKKNPHLRLVVSND